MKDKINKIADKQKYLRETIALLNSMVNCQESHSLTSIERVGNSMKILREELGEEEQDYPDLYTDRFPKKKIKSPSLAEAIVDKLHEGIKRPNTVEIKELETKVIQSVIDKWEIEKARQGEKFPETPAELEAFDEAHKDYKFECDVNAIDPEKILKSARDSQDLEESPIIKRAFDSIPPESEERVKRQAELIDLEERARECLKDHIGLYEPLKKLDAEKGIELDMWGYVNTVVEVMTQFALQERETYHREKMHEFASNYKPDQDLEERARDYIEVRGIDAEKTVVQLKHPCLKTRGTVKLKKLLSQFALQYQRDQKDIPRPYMRNDSMIKWLEKDRELFTDWIIMNCQIPPDGFTWQYKHSYYTSRELYQEYLNQQS